MKNRVAPEIESAVVELAIAQPAWGQVRVSNELRKRGLSISPFGVRGVWARHGLLYMKARLRALEAKVAHAKLYDRKTPITAAALLNDRVLPFYESHGIAVLRVLTDRGTEYCGNPEHHDYELYLAMENIDQSRTKTKSPQTNGICERFHRTMLDEFYRVAFRKKLYRSIEELQADLDAWLLEYNEHRSHQGRWRFDKTPKQNFLDTLRVVKEKMLQAAA